MQVQPVLDVEDVRRVEVALVREGVSLAELMRRAGRAAAHEALELADGAERPDGGPARVVVLCGMGNNGGDGWVAAQALLEEGLAVSVVSPVEPRDLSTDLARTVAASAVGRGVPYVVGPGRQQLEEILSDADVVVDAILGTGFHGKPRTPFDIWIDCVNACSAAVVAVDAPSGLSASTGHAPGGCVLADVTVTMLALKPGLLADEGRDACGRVVLAPLVAQAARLASEQDPVGWRAEAADYLAALSPASAAVDKYARGSVLVVGGSSRYVGAPILAARAAARAGAGYVTLAVPECVVPQVQAHVLEIPVVGLPADERGSFGPEAAARAAELAGHAGAVLVGPGMTVTSSTGAVVTALLSTEAPLVVDADGLNCLARLTSNHLEEYPEAIRREAPLVLTPHRRELGRLVGHVDAPPASLVEQVEDARTVVWADGGSNVAVLAKGSATASVGAEEVVLPKPGPAALATAGSGDVLGGIVAALLAQAGRDETDVVLLAARAAEIHGIAGEMAMEARGSRGVMALDVADAVGLAADELEARALGMGDDGVEEDEVLAPEPGPEVAPATVGAADGAAAPGA